MLLDYIKTLITRFFLNSFQSGKDYFQIKTSFFEEQVSKTRGY